MSRRLFDVFISSTQRDLAEERQQLTQALLRTDFRPVQMETFPATRRRADQLITDLVLRSDYVVLVLGFEYGSIIADESISFTELEYRCAREKGIPVLAFLRDAPPGTTLGPEITSFRDRVQAELVCQFWSSTTDLVQKVLQSLSWESVDSPAAGWVRADDLGPRALEYISDTLLPARELGISRISLDGVAGSRMGTELRRARDIRIMSTSGLRLVETQKTALIRAVEDGASLRVLVPDESSEFLRDVGEVEGRDPSTDTIAREIGLLGTRLAEIAEATHDSSGSVRLGRMTTQLRVTLTLTEEWGWMSLTLPPLRTPETASFELEGRGAHALLPRVGQHFEAVWAIARSRGMVQEIR